MSRLELGKKSFDRIAVCIMKLPALIYFAVLHFALGITPVVAATSIHVSTLGNDANSGTVLHPVATVKKAIEMVDGVGGPGEIVIHAGRYFGSMYLGNPGATANRETTTLAIHAGVGETVVFDGSELLQNCKPLDGSAGVFVFKGDFKPFQPPYLWEPVSRTRYLRAADLQAVKSFPGSVALLDEKTAVFHTTNGQPPSEQHEVRCGREQTGVFSARDNLTIAGLRFENYLSWQWSAGITVQNGRNVTIEDCSADNCVRGFLFGAGSMNGQLLRCKSHDCAEGVHIQGTRARVEGCWFTKLRDNYMLPIFEQDDSGIEAYSPANGLTIVRNNFVRGFANGIFMKAGGGPYLVEHNTLVGGPDGKIGTFNNNWREGDIFRRNIITEYATILQTPSFLKPGGLFDENVIWSQAAGPGLEANMAEIRANNNGKHDIVRDPHFADPDHDDYRLLPTSPALTVGDDHTPAGAFGLVPVSYVNRYPPLLQVEAQAPAVAAGAYGKLFLDRDEWLGGGRKFVGSMSAAAAPDVYLTPSRTVKLELKARHTTSPLSRLKIQIDRLTPEMVDYREEVSVLLPDTDGPHRVTVAVQNKDGQWSPTVPTNVVLARRPPRLVGTPQVASNGHGALIVFQTDRPVIAEAQITIDATPARIPSPNASVMRKYDSNSGEQHVEEWVKPSLRHTVALALPGIRGEQKYRYRIDFKDQIGNSGESIEGDFFAHGQYRILYVATTGNDETGSGSEARPFHSIQAALDRALPGDTVQVAPGLYSAPVYAGRGGIEGAPITIEAARPNTVTLDGRKTLPTIIQLENAPYITIRNLNLRWFRHTGVLADHSPYLTVSHCRFINDFWMSGFMSGMAVALRDSTNCNLDHNIASCMENGFYMLNSPQPTLTYNTTAALMYGGASLIYNSCKNAIVKNNAFCFSGNDSLVVIDRQADGIATLDADYNNYGTNVRSMPERLHPRQKYLFGGSKGVVLAMVGPQQEERRLKSLEEWQQFSGKDRHSICSDPRWIEPALGRWDVEKDSPNIGAGENGTTIGALGFLDDDAKP